MYVNNSYVVVLQRQLSSSTSRFINTRHSTLFWIGHLISFNYYFDFNVCVRACVRAWVCGGGGVRVCNIGLPVYLAQRLRCIRVIQNL